MSDQTPTSVCGCTHQMSDIDQTLYRIVEQTPEDREVITDMLEYGVLVPRVPVEVVKVLPDQTLSRLLADLQIDITDGTYAIVRLEDDDE